MGFPWISLFIDLPIIFSMFHKFILDFPNYFRELENSVLFEPISNGRQGAILVKKDNNLTPIVRSTTQSYYPPMVFKDIHLEIANKIQSIFPNFRFNNALIEKYTNDYKKMGFHSDLSLDLEDDSYIALFSCYRNPNNPNRKLVIKGKEYDTFNETTLEKLLENNSIIIFSTETNRNFLHKIVYDYSVPNDENEWIGITFRLSKTFIYFSNSQPLFYPSNIPLRIISKEEEKSFFKLRSIENNQISPINSTSFYPQLDYTLSYSDLKEPI